MAFPRALKSHARMPTTDNKRPPMAYFRPAGFSRLRSCQTRGFRNSGVATSAPPDSEPEDGEGPSDRYESAVELDGPVLKLTWPALREFVVSCRAPGPLQRTHARHQEQEPAQRQDRTAAKGRRGRPRGGRRESHRDQSTRETQGGHQGHDGTLDSEGDAGDLREDGWDLVLLIGVPV